MFSQKIYVLIFVCIFTVYAFVAFFFGCEPPRVGQKDEYGGRVITIISPNGTGEWADSITIRVYEIDGCEYIGNLSPMSKISYLTHKGNCKFCQRSENNDR